MVDGSSICLLGKCLSFLLKRFVFLYIFFIEPEEDAKPVSSIAVKRKADAAEAGSPKKANIA